MRRDYAMGMHTHDFVEVNVVLGGDGYHYVPGGRFPLRCGDAFVIPPGLEHGYWSSGDLDVRHLLLPPELLRRHALALRALPGYLLLFTVEPFFRQEGEFRYRLRLEGDPAALARRLLERIEAEGRSPDEASRLIAEHETLALLGYLCRWYAVAVPAAQQVRGDRMDALRSVFRLVESRYAEKLTLEDLARAAHLQRNHFCRVFRAAAGMPRWRTSTRCVSAMPATCCAGPIAA